MANPVDKGALSSFTWASPASRFANRCNFYMNLSTLRPHIDPVFWKAILLHVIKSDSEEFGVRRKEANFQFILALFILWLIDDGLTNFMVGRKLENSVEFRRYGG